METVAIVREANLAEEDRLTKVTQQTINTKVYLERFLRQCTRKPQPTYS